MFAGISGVLSEPEIFDPFLAGRKLIHAGRIIQRRLQPVRVKACLHFVRESVALAPDVQLPVVQQPVQDGGRPEGEVLYRIRLDGLRKAKN